MMLFPRKLLYIVVAFISLFAVGSLLASSIGVIETNMRNARLYESCSRQAPMEEPNLIDRLRAVEEALKNSTTAIESNTEAVQGIGAYTDFLTFAGVATAIATLLFAAIGMVNHALSSFAELTKSDRHAADKIDRHAAEAFGVDAIDIYRYVAFVLIVVQAFLIFLYLEHPPEIWAIVSIEILVAVGSLSLWRLYRRDKEFLKDRGHQFHLEFRGRPINSPFSLVAVVLFACPFLVEIKATPVVS